LRTKFIIYFFTISISANSQNLELNFSQANFDSNNCCWRKLANSGQYIEAANLVVMYLKKGNVSNKQSLNWHASQLFAMAGDNKMALKYLNKSSNIFHYWFGGSDGKTWYLYVHGVKAFIKRDRKKLNDIINLWNKKYPVDLNYKQLVLLSSNWNKTYLEASK